MRVQCADCKGSGCSEFWPLRQTCSTCEGTGSVIAVPERRRGLFWVIAVVVSLIVAAAIVTSCSGDRLGRATAPSKRSL